LLLAATLSSGCGKSEGSDAPVPQSEFPTRFADLVCDSLANCCQSAGFAMDVTGCKQAQVARRSAALSMADPQKVEYDARAAGECLAAARSVIRCGQLESVEAPACDDVLRGKLQLGEPCTESDECQPQPGEPYIRCASQGDDALSVCTTERGQEWPRGARGEACTMTCFDDDCSGIAVPVPNLAGGEAPFPRAEVACFRNDGLYCERGTCARTLAVGRACDDEAACSGNAFCDRDTRTCVTPRADGEPCGADSQCESKECGDVAPYVDEPSAPQVCVRGRVYAAQCGKSFNAQAPSPEPVPPPGSE
jgi:hypothetical protein